MNTTFTIIVVVIVLTFVVAATIIAYPALEAHARSLTAAEGDKGQQGNLASGGSRQGGGCGRICG
jgi:hypothetical protein